MRPAPKAEEIAKRAKSRVQLVLVGCNHRTAPVELRERVAFTPAQAIDAAAELKRRGMLEEAVVLSTCNRSELYGVPRERETTKEPNSASEMENFFSSYHGIPRADFAGHTYSWSGQDAVKHLFRVAAGLDSMMLGEAEILGQIKTAYGLALEQGLT